MEIEKFNNKDNWMEEFSNQRPDLFFPESWSDEQKAEVVEQVRPNKVRTAMFAKIPMKCRGSKCPVAGKCPLAEKGMAPVGKPCPFEMAIVQDMMQALMRDLNVDPDDRVEVGMIRTLVDIEIQYLRASDRLSLEDFIMDSVIGINENTGEPIMKKDMHLAVDLQDRLLKRQKDILNRFMATREAKAKLGISQVDSAKVLSDIFTQMREIDIQQEKLLKKKIYGLTEGIEDAEVIEDSDDNEE